jgi:hypothetical protein
MYADAQKKVSAGAALFEISKAASAVTFLKTG